MGRVILVSNRLPYRVDYSGDKPELRLSEGGLAVGLGSVYQNYADCIWVGWPGVNNAAQTGGLINKKLSDASLYPVFPDEAMFDLYYYGYSNSTLWPLFHSLTHPVSIDPAYFEAYVGVNQLFCDHLASLYRDGDTIFIQDYHLMLLPALLREILPGAKISFFLHIPFPAFELFRILPEREAIIRGLLGADVVGFHTYDYALHFMDCAKRLCFATDVSPGYLSYNDRHVHVGVFPLGINFDKFEQAALSPGVAMEEASLRCVVGDQKVVLSIDRLDHTKGLHKRLMAFEHFLDVYPSYLGKVVFYMVAVPSRTKDRQYAQLRRTVTRVVMRINTRFSADGWQPVIYTHTVIPFNRIVALYKLADVVMEASLRDGMNLVAKEYAASRSDGRGVLILSELAGAIHELPDAIAVNPHDIPAMSVALFQALCMSPDEQAIRMRRMQAVLRSRPISTWFDMLMEATDHARNLNTSVFPLPLDVSVTTAFYSRFSQASERLIFLDYDGTLQTFFFLPQDAVPDASLMSLLIDLSGAVQNTVVLISSRSKHDLEAWFGHLQVHLVAENGAMVKHAAGEWRNVFLYSPEWKKQLRPFLDWMVMLIPGLMIEEKDVSIALHYRHLDPVCFPRLVELITTLSRYWLPSELDLIYGVKVVEIVLKHLNKGGAALPFLAAHRGNCVLAIGDSNADEPLFKAVGPAALSVVVGKKSSSALYYVETVEDVRHFLEGLACL